MANNPLAKKLQLKPGVKGLVINAPPGYLERLEPLPEGVELGTEQNGGQLDFVQLFVKDQAQLESSLSAAIGAVKPDALLWISYLKGGTKAGTDLNRDILWKLVEPTGLRPVTLVALDDAWSSMRFRPVDRVGK